MTQDWADLLVQLKDPVFRRAYVLGLARVVEIPRTSDPDARIHSGCGSVDRSATGGVVLEEISSHDSRGLGMNQSRSHQD